MSRVKRSDCLLLALMLAVSMIALSGHATVHANAASDACLMCASHSDPHSAAHVHVIFSQPAGGQGNSQASHSEISPPIRPLATPQPRAPPVVS